MPSALAGWPRARAGQLPGFAVLGTAVLLGLAVLAYRDGDITAHDVSGFSFEESFISDLGRIRTPGERTNVTPRVLFAFAMLLGGAALVGIVMQRGIRPVRHRFWKGMLLAVSTVTAASVVAIGVTPWDCVPFAHGVAVGVAFAALPVLVGMLAREGYHAGDRVMCVASMILLPLLVTYFVLLRFGPGFETHSGLVTQAIAQKVVVLGLLIWAAILAFRPKTAQNP